MFLMTGKCTLKSCNKEQDVRMTKQGIFCVGALVAMMGIQPIAYAQQSDLYQFSAHFIDLAMFTDESMTGDHTTNSASLLLNADLNLVSDQNHNFGRIKIQYAVNGLNDDAQLNTSTNWMGGVGSYIGGAIAANDLAPMQLSLFTWDKKWNDQLFSSVGRTNIRRHFLYNNCENPVLCTDPIKGAMGSLPVSYGYWGAYLKYDLNDQFYVHSGIYEVNTDDYVNKNKGLDFSTKKSIGETQVYGLGYHFNPKNKAEILYFNNNSEYKNAFTKQLYEGTEGLNFRFDYDFGQSYLPTFFGAYSYINETNQPYKSYWELGFHYPLNESFKHIGLKYGRSSLNDDFVKHMTTINGNDHQEASFISIDTKFKYKNLTLSPFAQYIWNPDNYYQAKGDVFENNVIVGLLTQFKIY